MFCLSVLLAPIGLLAYFFLSGPLLAYTHLLDKQVEFGIGKCFCHFICNLL